jgi:TolB protein
LFVAAAFGVVTLLGPAAPASALPAWPSGAVLFSSARSGRADIYLVDSRSNTLVRMTTDPAADVVPSWNPATDDAFAFASNRTGSFDIWTQALDGGAPVRVTTGRAGDTDPAWSPDGTRIAFARSKAGAPAQIFVVDLAGSRVRRMTSDGGADLFPSWSPDGKRIAFQSTVGGSTTISTVDVGTRAERPLTSAPGHDTQPAWSPNGAAIAFASNRGGSGGAGIWVIGSDGGQPAQVDGGPGDSSPSWDSTGTRIRFVQTTGGPGGSSSIVEASRDGSTRSVLWSDPAAVDRRAVSAPKSPEVRTEDESAVADLEATLRDANDWADANGSYEGLTIVWLEQHDPSRNYSVGDVASSPGNGYIVSVATSTTNTSSDTFTAARLSASGDCYSIREIRPPGAAPSVTYGWSETKPCSADSMGPLTNDTAWPS